jgi:hypothetical protein
LKGRYTAPVGIIKRGQKPCPYAKEITPTAVCPIQDVIYKTRIYPFRWQSSLAYFLTTQAYRVEKKSLQMRGKQSGISKDRP